MKKAELKEVVIRIKQDATVTCEEVYQGNIVKSKYIRPEDLYSAIKSSGHLAGIDSGILPEGCVFYRQDADGNHFVVIKFSGKVDFNLLGEVYPDFPLPTLLFGFKIAPGGHIYKRMLTCIKGSRVRMNTKLCKYPFSNVYEDYSLCLGGNRLKDVDYIYQTESMPYMVLSMQNNKDLYTIKNNTLGLAYSDLLEHIQKEGRFDDGILVETSKTVKDFISKLTDTDVNCKDAQPGEDQVEVAA